MNYRELAEAFEKLITAMLNTLKIKDLSDRLSTTMELQQNNWNCDARLNRNGTISYRWNDNPNHKLLAGDDQLLLNQYRLAGQEHTGHWYDNDGGWVSLRDMHPAMRRRRQSNQDGYDTDDSELQHRYQRRHRHF